MHAFQHQPVLVEKLANGRVDHRALFRREVAVAAPGNRDQLIDDTDLVQRLVQPHTVLIRHHAIGIAVDREDRRQTFAHVGQRRHARRDLGAVRQAAQPGHRRIRTIGPVDDVVHVGHTEPVDRRSDCGNRCRPGALTIETRAVRNHCARQRQVSPGRLTHRHDAIHVDVVGLGLCGEIPQCTEAVFDGRRRRSDSCQPILDVDDVPAHLHPRNERQQRSFLGTGRPEAAMKVHEGRLRSRHVAPRVDIELGFVVARREIRQVRHDAILIRGMGGPICRR